MDKMDQKIVDELKIKLMEEKKSLEKELSDIAKPTGVPGVYETKHDEIGEGQDDNASEMEEYSDNFALENNLEKQLKETSDALSRIESGAYGVCGSCGMQLSLDRLRAYPAARKCIQCK